MKNLRTPLKEAVVIPILTFAGAIGILNILSYEPMIMLAPPGEIIPKMNAKQYAENHPFGKTIGYLCYPGAKLGRYDHNRRVDEWNARQTQL